MIINKKIYWLLFFSYLTCVHVDLELNVLSLITIELYMLVMTIAGGGHDGVVIWAVMGAWLIFIGQSAYLFTQLLNSHYLQVRILFIAPLLQLIGAGVILWQLSRQYEQSSITYLSFCPFVIMIAIMCRDLLKQSSSVSTTVENR